MAEGELEKSCFTCKFGKHCTAAVCGECLFSDKPILPYWAPVDIHPEEEVKSLFDDWDDEEWDVDESAD